MIGASTYGIWLRIDHFTEVHFIVLKVRLSGTCPKRRQMSHMSSGMIEVQFLSSRSFRTSHGLPCLPVIGLTLKTSSECVYASECLFIFLIGLHCLD